MGATTFETEGEGKTAEIALRAVLERALWEHGHGSYTGTIAEKDSCVVLSRPPSIRETTMRKLPQLLQDEGYYRQVRQDTWATEAEKKRADKHDALMAKLPPILASRVRNRARIYDDKWGPAIAVELGNNKWIFCGLASS